MQRPFPWYPNLSREVENGFPYSDWINKSTDSLAVDDDNWTTRWSVTTSQTLAPYSIVDKKLETVMSFAPAFKNNKYSLNLASYSGDFTWGGVLTVSDITIDGPGPTLKGPTSALIITMAGEASNILIGWVQSNSNGIEGWGFRRAGVWTQVELDRDGGTKKLGISRIDEVNVISFDDIPVGTFENDGDISSIAVIESNGSGGTGFSAGYTGTWHNVGLLDGNGDRVLMPEV